MTFNGAASKEVVSKRKYLGDRGRELPRLLPALFLIRGPQARAEARPGSTPIGFEPGADPA